MEVLITGTAGFIGYFTALCFLQNGYNVIGIDNINSYYDKNLKKSRIKLLKKFKNFKEEKIDLTDFKKVKKIFEKYNFEKVIHLAAQPGIRYSLENPHSYIKSNIDGFLNMLECCKNKKIKHLIFASSSSVYGANLKTEREETDSCDYPINIYSATKRADELMAYSYSHLFNLPVTALRFFNVYGPFGRPDSALFKFTKNILEEKPIEIFNNGEMVRDFTYVQDIVEAIKKVFDGPIPVKTLNKPEETNNKEAFKIYNIGHGKPVKLMQYINEIENATGKKAKLEFLPLQKGEIIEAFSCTKKFEQDYGYKPQTELKDGVQSFVNWFKEYYGN